MYRVFGSPYTLTLHQNVTYLRLKQLPFRVYCTNFSTTLLYSLYYRARNALCTLTPGGRSVIQVWQLAEAAETDEALSAVVRGTVKGRDTDPSHGSVASTAAPIVEAPQRILVNKKTHPRLNLACWSVVLYASWWLAKTGGMFRYFKSDTLDVLEGYIRFFFIVPFFGARSIAPAFRKGMQGLIATTGVNEGTIPFMEEHFYSMCAALDSHFADPRMRFLLGTPHPTLADVNLGAVFSAFFTTDDPPASSLERYPHLSEYVERVTGWRAGQFEQVRPEASPHDAAEDYPDTVPESLEPFFALVVSVMPFMMSQCAAFNSTMSSDAIRSMTRQPLEGEWSGCSGYLLPQVTNIFSLMIIDNTVLEVHVRAQDLEVAFTACREVLDDELEPFNRSPQKMEEENTGKDGAVDGAAATTGHSNRALATALTMRAAEQESESGNLSTSVDSTSSSVGDVSTRAPRQFFENVCNPRLPGSLEDQVIASEDADFYRVFTKKSRGTRSTSHPRQLARLHAQVESSLTEGNAAAPSSPVNYQLDILRAMMSKMHSPQYTLASVFHKRRMYVAAIPEYEVEKVRQARLRKAKASDTIP